MPVLSIDHSTGALTALYIENPSTYKIVHFPILIPDISFAHKPSKSEALEMVLADLQEEFGVKFEEAKIYISSLYNLQVSNKNINICSKSDAFKSLVPLDFLYFSHLHVGSKNGIFHQDLDYSKILDLTYMDEKENTFQNYIENLKLYPYTIPSSDRDYYEEEALLKYVAVNHCSIQNSGFTDFNEIVFSTTRDVTTAFNLSRFMLLCIDSVCQPGFYKFVFDQQNFLGAAAATSFYDSELFTKLEFPDFRSLGSVVNICDDLECILETKEGKAINFKVAKHQIYAVPIEEPEIATITLQTKKHGTLKRKIYGGHFGLVFDTRDKQDLKVQTPEQRKTILKTWENVLFKSLKGL